MLNQYAEALEPLRTMLAADGYWLQVESTTGDFNEVTLTVEAEPDACEDCLVPVDLFRAIVNQHLTDNGLEPNITIAYPLPG